MRLLSTRPGGHAAALFGLGLIGGAIHDALAHGGTRTGDRTDHRNGDRNGDESWSGGWTTTPLPFSWTDAEARAAQTQAIARQIETLAPSRCDLIWAAGAAGFSASTPALAAEARTFEAFCALARSLGDSLPGTRLRVHLLSSAGGLFEGQTHVGRTTRPAPRRPYGTAKLALEAAALALAQSDAGAVTQLAGTQLLGTQPTEVQIYRPSSVYGFRPGGRMGLVPALIRGVLTHRPVHIFGATDTIRDYVLAEDIGRFIAERVAAPGGDGGSPPPPSTHLLASGRPTAMTEMFALVGQIMGRSPYLQLDPAPANAQPMSFLPSALPPGWRPTALETGVRQIARAVSAAQLT